VIKNNNKNQKKKVKKEEMHQLAVINHRKQRNKKVQLQLKKLLMILHLFQSWISELVRLPKHGQIQTQINFIMKKLIWEMEK